MSNWELLDVEAHPSMGKPFFSARFIDRGDPDLHIDLCIMLTPQRQAKVVSTAVELVSEADNERGIPAGRLRSIPYGELTLKVLGRLNHPAVRARGLGNIGQPQHEYDYRELRQQWPNGDVERVSKAVADSYTAAITSGQPPKPTIAERFEVSTSTASRMIAKARELGFLRAQSVGGRPKQKDRSDGTQTPRRRRIGDNIHKESK